ncbi:sigma-70 family RNA polymerase sigma factor [Actinomycetes bacterium KLBMP 9797]
MSDAAGRFTAAFQRHHLQVYAYALRRVDEASAHDVVAETFLAAWRHIDRLPEDPLPWLYRTAGYCVANQGRGSRRQARLAGRMVAAAEVTAPDHADTVVEASRLHAALAELNAADREALLLVAWEGLDHRAAAFAAGCSAATFRVRLYRARRRLARLLREAPSPHARLPLAASFEEM